MTLPNVVRSGVHVVLRLRATGAEPEAGDHLVEHQQRADPVALGAQPLEEAGRGSDDAHVGGDRLDEHRGHVVVELRAPRCTARPSSRRPRSAGTPAVPGRPSVATPLPPAASSASVAPWKLPWKMTIRSRPVYAAGEAHGGARRLGARVHQPHPLAARHPVGDRLGELHLAGRRRAVRRAVRGRGGDGAR